MADDSARSSRKDARREFIQLAPRLGSAKSDVRLVGDE